MVQPVCPWKVMMNDDLICNGCRTFTTFFDWQYWLVYEVVGSCGPAANSELTAWCCSSVVHWYALNDTRE